MRSWFGVKTFSCASSPSPNWPSVFPPQTQTYERISRISRWADENSQFTLSVPPNSNLRDDGWRCCVDMFPVCESHVLTFDVTWCRIGWVGGLVILPVLVEAFWGGNTSMKLFKDWMGWKVRATCPLSVSARVWRVPAASWTTRPSTPVCLWWSMFVYEHHHGHHSQHVSSW